MKIVFYLAAPFLASSLISCAVLQRSDESGYKEYRDQSGNSSNEEKDSSKSEMSGKISRASPYGYLTEEERSQLLAKQKVHQLEKTLVTRKEQEHYSRILPWLKSEDEKIQYLSLNSPEEKQAWLNRNDIWKRSKTVHGEHKSIVDSQDIAIGMPQDLVRKAWGEPVSVEASGNPLYKNERWKYSRYITVGDGFKQERRYVFFEGGRVVGWETE